MTDNGNEASNFVMLSRKLFDNFLWKEERIYSKAEAWIDLIREARYLEKPEMKIMAGQNVTWGRGQLVGSLRFLADRWHWSTKKVSNFISLLEKEKMITVGREKETAITVITLCKYEVYNTPPEKKKQQRNSEETAGKQRGNKTNIENIVNKEEGTAAPTLPLFIEEIQPKAEELKLEADYKAFNEWLKKNAPQVLKMAEPITLEEFKRLFTEFCMVKETRDLLKEKLVAMHNKKTLTSEYRSANLTLRKWMKYGSQNPAPVITLPKGGKSARELQDEKILNEVYGLDKLKQG